MNTPVSPDAYSELVSGIEEKIGGGEAPAWVLYEPDEARQIEDAGVPPDRLSDPVWTAPDGWMEREDAPTDPDGDEPMAFTWIDPDTTDPETTAPDR
jgi:hypothetical protein